MYKITLKETKTKPISGIEDFVALMGDWFFGNHRWKVVVNKSSKPLPQLEKETVVNGLDLLKIIQNGVKFKEASFSALEGSQIVVKLVIEDGLWTVYSAQIRWVEFFDEKCKIINKEEFNVDLPEFAEFMQV